MIFLFISISRNILTIQICPISKDCKHSARLNAWCLPKCCALDETFLFWEKRCVKVSKTDGDTPWIPPIHQSSVNWEEKIKSRDATKNIAFQIAWLPKSCPLVLKLPDGSEEAFFLHSTAALVPHPSGDNDMAFQGDKMKLVLPQHSKTGVIKPMGFNIFKRRWTVSDALREFCVDGFRFSGNNSTDVHSGADDNYVVIFCGAQPQVTASWIAWSYVVVSVVSLCFLVAILIVYIALWETHNLHKMIVLCQTFAETGTYTFLIIAQLASLYPESLGAKLGLGERGRGCYAIGTSISFLYCYRLEIALRRILKIINNL